MQILDMEISFVIPVYNEKENVRNLHREIIDLCKKENYAFEIIIIDDYSTDGTFEELLTLKPLSIIKFRRNYGQTQALDAGIKLAKYPLILTMDGDGQNDPSDLPKMIRTLLDNQADIVSGWRVERKDPFLKKFVSRGADFLRKILINDTIHDSGCGIKLYKKSCFKGISLYGEMHRFIPAILSLKGYKVAEIPVNHRPRLYGKSKYSWKRMAKGFIDMVSIWYWKKYALRPLHLLGGMGLFLVFISILFGFGTIIQYFRGQDLSETLLPLLTLFTFLLGIQFFISGLMTDLLVKLYYNKNEDQPYSISEIVEVN